MAVRLRLSDLENLAQKAGFESYQQMLHELYTVQGLGLYQLAERCHIHYKRVRRHLNRFGIPIRGRGGPNSVKVVFTPELLTEIIKNGVEPTAQRLGITPVVLRSRLNALKNK